MDQSYSEEDVSLSPSQILERLQMLRQWQLLQRGQLQKQQLQYHETSEITSSFTELVSHFSNSTSYNTFRTLLQSAQESADEISPRLSANNIISRKSNLQNVIDGVSVLNLSGESITNSPISSRSTASVKQDSSNQQSAQVCTHTLSKKQISLDDMPILSPKKDFETLISEKLKHETAANVNANPKKIQNNVKPFLKKGQGTARFGLRKNDFKIQNTTSLPWRKKGLATEPQKINMKSKSIESKENTQSAKIQVQIVVDKPKDVSPLKITSLPQLKKPHVKINSLGMSDCNEKHTLNKQIDNISETNSNIVSENHSARIINYPKEKHPLATSKEKTWAAVFTKEQDDFLRKLKQSEYYKNFASPAKSTVSDVSCDEQLLNIRQQKEETEQNMFELIENKVSHESFAMDNSFFSRFIRKHDLECSGESTPLVLQKCLSKNPNLMHILPDVMHGKKNDETCSDAGTCDSDYTECSENCSSASSCCSCKTVTESNLNTPCNKEDETKERVPKKIVQTSKKFMDDKQKDDVQCHNDSVTATNEAMNANIAEMNSKLIATSELLKDRLRELEDEIETFRKENANLNKMREEIDLERQKFYEEKTAFEQKFNEEKVLSEYYLAEEKEKLGKQKQMYERYVREMRGRLSKKEKDEVVNLKKEIHDLKEEIKLKDAKSTSLIARLRNQIKIMEKDKKNLEDEVEKLKKENRRIQHSNEITRRLTNLKYLEQINKKLSNMATKDTESEVKLDPDVKYRSYEIERQSRSRKCQPATKGAPKKRAKSVPNLKVTSRYAKYFSQKDSLSEKDKNKTTNGELQMSPCSYEDDMSTSDNELNLDLSNINRSNSDSEDENNLEKIYNDRFKSPSPNSKRASTSTSDNSPEFSSSKTDGKDFFIQKPGRKTTQNSSSKRLSPHERTSYHMSSSASNSSNLSKRMSNDHQNPNILKHQDYASDSHMSSNQRTRSPVTILSNHSSSKKPGSVINKELLPDTRMIPSPEPTSSKTSLPRTNLNPIEIRKPDGTKELKFPNGNVKLISADGKYSKFIYYNGDIKENFYNEGRIKYYYAETKTFHTTHPDGLEVLEFPDGQVEKRYKDGSSEIRLPNGSVRYFDPKNDHVREEWRFPDGAALTVSASGEQRIMFPNGQVEVHAKDHKRREFPDGTIKLVYNDGTSETRYASGRVRIKDKHGNLIMDSSAS
ncbi:centromere protein J [Maniola jurtina]|uniref:centromere protein J n=1 Tax=Maniola jurtina TaxID=191418 RepID=UPI001E68B659|nr:centromere protein J [Maniola jurtina]